MAEVWTRARQFGMHRAKMALLSPSAPFRGGNPSGGTDTRARSAQMRWRVRALATFADLDVALNG